MKETEVAAPVVKWLQEQGWEVFQEVDNRIGIADIVGRWKRERGKDLIWVIEVKTSLTLRVLDQAIAWTPWAHLVSVAVPAARNARRMSNRATKLVLNHYGLGLIYVGGYDRKAVSEQKGPSLHRVKMPSYPSWSKVLVEEQKTHCAAGSPSGGHWTPFKGTCKQLRQYVEDHPGCLMKEAVESIDHHYFSKASAVSSLRALVQDGVVPGVRFELDGRKVRLYAEDKS